nr:glycosyl hydrolase 115 family protein [Phaeacidiphilus oryzae]
MLIGTLGRSPVIDRLAAEGKIDTSGVAGRWETSLQQVVDRPLPGVDRALVIAGSDQRGTIYGLYDVSYGIGVSPWYWWADAAPTPREQLWILPGRHTQGTPAVRYRGFFINDDNPVLDSWAVSYFGKGLAAGYPGGLNHFFYARIFEVMLRLKANYLWPAVWGRAFALDDPQNHATATAYGVVMGTSHEAPMLRGIEEWNRFAVPAVRDAQGNITTPGHDPYGGTGEWSFRYNSDALKAYWREGIQRMVDQKIEGVVTIGMRGNGDTALTDGAGIDLMQQIIDAQRQIIAEVTGKDAALTPQCWTLYKEVQRYWAEGLRAPSDVIINLCDDNWGNMRMLPDPAEPARSGGYGIYYHDDYVGAGRNYMWLSTSNLANMWEQLHQVTAYGDSSLWMLNAGVFKKHEAAVQFFLDYSWNPDRWPLERLTEWQVRFARQNLGAEQAAAIGAVLHRYGVLQARRKPELLNRRITTAADGTVHNDDAATPFAPANYRELERVTADWQELADEAERIARALPASAQDAFTELVGYPVRATANVYALRQAEFTNLRYAAQGRAATNALADRTAACFATDQDLQQAYNSQVANGKWAGFMIQPHLDYGDVARYGSDASWQQPPLPDMVFPAVQRITLAPGAEMGVALDGTETAWWPQSPAADAVLPALSRWSAAPPPYIEIFNRGSQPFDYTVRSGASWLTVGSPSGRIDTETRLELRADWARAPRGTTRVPLTVSGSEGTEVVVTALVENPSLPAGARGHVEADGHVSILAPHYSRAFGGSAGIDWTTLADLGRDGSVVTPFPVTAARQTPGAADSPRLEYDVVLLAPGEVRVTAYLSPRNHALASGSLAYAVSFDGAAPQSVDIVTATGSVDATLNDAWARNTSNNVNATTTSHSIAAAGNHTLRFWMVDPTVILHKLVIDTGGLRWSYLGPPESHRLS